jgi:hypothetical protein
MGRKVRFVFALQIILAGKTRALMWEFSKAVTAHCCQKDCQPQKNKLSIHNIFETQSCGLLTRKRKLATGTHSAERRQTEVKRVVGISEDINVL